MRTAIGLSLVGAIVAVSGCSDRETSTPATTTDEPAAVESSSGGDDKAAATSTTSIRPADGPTTTSPPATERTSTTFPIVEVPETGVPGIDSEDAFCAAWSRFGGSWQVIQVAAAFAPDPSVVPAMEVVASPVIGDAYDAIFDVWPDELADERDAVAESFFGPLDRRAFAAETALVAAGASPDDIAAIGASWVDALAGRELENPVLIPELTDAQRGLVDAAAASFSAQLVDFRDDPSMRITVETPATDAYLATACPDQGALAGTEVDAG